MSGFRFYTLTRDWDDGEPNAPGTEVFEEQIRKLAREIFETLQSLKDLSQEKPFEKTRAVPQVVFPTSSLVTASVPEPVQPTKSAVFISYRRGEGTPYAGRLYDKLAARFGEDRVFMDLDTIEPGDDFIEVITNYVKSCSILIALINKAWLDVKDDEGRRRLDNPEDFVNLEISIALERNIRVIPVLVQGASMPRKQDLPTSLTILSRRNAHELSDSRWTYDVDKLIKILEKHL